VDGNRTTNGAVEGGILRPLLFMVVRSIVKSTLSHLFNTYLELIDKKHYLL
jgi:hypothetical protein